MTAVQRWVLVICAAIFLLVASYTVWTWRGNLIVVNGNLALSHHHQLSGDVSLSGGRPPLIPERQ